MRRSAGLLAGLFGVALIGCSEPTARAGGASITAPAADDPIAFGDLPEFELIDQLGRSVTRETLLGRPLVLAAIYSRCVGPCPAITKNMQRLQRELEGTGALLVSVSVDPEHDTPEVLASHAEAYGADPQRWLFLTGAEEEAHRLVREGLMLAVQRADGVDIGSALTHSNRLAAVDASGRLRGWYVGTDDGQLGRLRRRMEALATAEE